MHSTLNRLFRHRAVALLALLMLSPLSNPLAAQDAPASVWWFPLGGPEADRRNATPTAAQSAAELQIKWRSGTLSGARQLLVGALLPTPDAGAQQIIGLRAENDSVILLNVLGRTERIFSPVSNERPGTRVVGLTGLFDTESRSVDPESRPNSIGVALQRTVTGSAQQVDRAYGLLVDPSGSVITRAGITAADAEMLLEYSIETNRTVSVYPVAAYRPEGSDSLEVLALISQNEFVANVSDGRRDSVINSLRVYRTPLSTPELYLEGRGIPFRIAPRTYREQPALRYLATKRQHVLALASSAYPFRDTILSPLPASSTRSGEASALHLRIPAGSSNISAISNELNLSNGVLSSGSLFADLLVDRVSGGPEERAIRFAVDVLEARPSAGPRLRLTEEDQNLSQGGVVFSADPVPYNGFEVVIADLDGSAPGNATDSVLVNNPGPELVVSRQIAGDPDSIRVMLYRLNEKAPIDDIALGFFTEQGLRGRIAAAGDIVSDGDGRQELIHVDGARLSILQLRPYREKEKIRPFNPDLAEPFTVLAEFDLPESIIDVAIADLEGDGRNDIVAGTAEGTYLIGTIVTRPFAFDAEPDNLPTLCPDDTLEYRWSRLSNGGGAPFGVSLELVGPEGSDSRVITDPSILNSGMLKLPVRDLNLSQSGVYRLIVRDGRLPHLSDTGAPFTFQSRTLGALSFDIGSQPLPAGATVTDTVPLRCVQGIRLQRSSDGSSWEDVPDGEGSIVEIPGGEDVAVSATLTCSTIDDCAAEGENQEIFFRLRTPSDSGEAVGVVLEQEILPVDLQTSESTELSRVRTVEWRADTIRCKTIRFVLTDGNGGSEDLGSVDRSDGSLRFRVPDDLSGRITLCATCVDESGCARKRLEFEVPGAEDRFYVAPNPFDPVTRSAAEMATIAYTVEETSGVTITLIDRSRSVVRTIIDGEERTPGRYRAKWDGTNQEGQTVANGTYFCVIELSGGESVVIPVLVLQ